MSAEDELLIAFELHSVKKLRSLLKGGVDMRCPVLCEHTRSDGRVRKEGAFARKRAQSPYLKAAT